MKNTPLVEEYLQSIDDIKEVKADHFFYTRLAAKMEKNTLQQTIHLPLKPVWIMTALLGLLIINFSLLLNQNNYKINNAFGDASIQNFAADYDQSVYTY